MPTINPKDEDGMTPFLFAAKKGYDGMCRLIWDKVNAIKKGVDLNIDLGNVVFSAFKILLFLL